MAESIREKKKKNSPCGRDGFSMNPIEIGFIKKRDIMYWVNETLSKAKKVV